MTPYQPTPHDIHQYDQMIADISHTLDVIIHAYNTTNTKFGDEQSTIGLMHIVTQKAENTEALAQYLAVACRRIAHLEQAIHETKAVITEVLDGSE